jgi:hypothetical protein
MSKCKHQSFEFDRNAREYVCQWCHKTEIEIKIAENKKKKDEATLRKL